HRYGAADREDGDRCVKPQFARGALCGTSECDEGANLQAALPCIAPRLLVLVCEERLTVIAEEALQELPVPGLVDLSGVRRGWPVRDATRCDDREALGCPVAGAPQRTPELVAALEWNERRALAVDVDWNDRQVVARRQETQRHHDAVIELPFLGIGEI